MPKLHDLGITKEHGFFDILADRFTDITTEEKNRLNLLAVLRWGKMDLVDTLTAENITDVVKGIEMLNAKRWDWLASLVWDGNECQTTETTERNLTDGETANDYKNGFESSAEAPKLDTRRVSERASGGTTTRNYSGYRNKADVFKFNNVFSKTNLYETVLIDIMNFLMNGTQVPETI